jgi:hypothetical protein
MTYEQLEAKWNSEDDEYNQWDNISIPEQVEFAYKVGLKRAECLNNLTQ